jgi:hypothetical protein
MRLANFIIIFLLAFTAQGSAQDKKPEIVWKNFQSEYQKFEHILDPTIVNESDQTIGFEPSVSIKNFIMAELLVFNEETQKWVSAGAYSDCGMIQWVKTKLSLKFYPKKIKRFYWILEKSLLDLLTKVPTITGLKF